VGKRSQKQKKELNKLKLQWATALLICRFDEGYLQSDRLDELLHLFPYPSDRDLIDFCHRWDLDEFPLERFHPDVLGRKFRLYEFFETEYKEKRKVSFKDLLSQFSEIYKDEAQVRNDLSDIIQLIFNKPLPDVKREIKALEIKLSDLPIICSQCWFKYWAFHEPVQSKSWLKFPPSKAGSFRKSPPFYDIEKLCPCSEVKPFVEQDQVEWPEIIPQGLFRDKRVRTETEEENTDDDYTEGYFWRDERQLGYWSEDSWEKSDAEDKFLSIYRKPHKRWSLWIKENDGPPPKPFQIKKSLTLQEIDEIKEWASYKPNLPYDDEIFLRKKKLPETSEWEEWRDRHLLRGLAGCPLRLRLSYRYTLNGLRATEWHPSTLGIEGYLISTLTIVEG
jgi:hypothetical protein